MNPIFPSSDTVILFTGNYGSGKTEVSVNVATALARFGGHKVTIADLDLVNPYFRAREAREQMEDLKINVVAPGGDMHNADLPILLPEVRGAVANPDGFTLLDVGGDNVGATVLSSLVPTFKARGYAMHFVLNKNRPFTDTVDGAMQLMDEIEAASKLKVTHIVGNTHLMDETTLEMAQDGAKFCAEAAERRGVETGFVTCPAAELIKGKLLNEDDALEIKGTLELDGFSGIPVLPLQRIMLPPWLGGAAPGSMVTHARDRFSHLTGKG
jgi:hypothetical protein